MTLVGVVVPAVIGAIGLVLIALSMPDLPDPIAIHWGVNGQPDGFGSVWTTLWVIPVIVLGFAALCLPLARSREPGVTTVQRLVLATGPFLATLVTVIIAGSVVIQRGLDDARDAPSIVPLMGIGLVAGLALGALALLVLPPATADPDTQPRDTPLLELSPTERAVWFQRIAPARWLSTLLLVVAVVAIGGGGLALWFFAPLWAFLVFVVVETLAALLVATTMFWRVRVDASGFAATAGPGWPRYEIPLDEVESCAVITVNPVRDFGGWGIRWGGKGRLGIITRTGSALEVRRTDGRRLVVTVSRPEQGAALLNSLAQRVH